MSSTMACAIASSDTETISSTYFSISANVRAEGPATATPSAIVRTADAATAWCRWTDWQIPSMTAAWTPTTRTAGRNAFTATATPASSPPPPAGTRISVTSGHCSRISSPIVPCPAMTASSSNGGTRIRPSRSAIARASTCASSRLAPWSTTRAPYRVAAEIFASGANDGITTVTLRPAVVPASAIPCAWFPALAATSPAPAAPGASDATKFVAPRILNDPVRWNCSHFSDTSTPAASESAGESNTGVSRIAGLMTARARRIASTVTPVPLSDIAHLDARYRNRMAAIGRGVGMVVV